MFSEDNVFKRKNIMVEFFHGMKDFFLRRKDCYLLNIAAADQEIGETWL